MNKDSKPCLGIEFSWPWSLPVWNLQWLNIVYWINLNSISPTVQDLKILCLIFFLFSFIASYILSTLIDPFGSDYMASMLCCVPLRRSMTVLPFSPCRPYSKAYSYTRAPMVGAPSFFWTFKFCLNLHDQTLLILSVTWSFLPLASHTKLWAPFSWGLWLIVFGWVFLWGFFVPRPYLPHSRGSRNASSLLVFNWQILAFPLRWKQFQCLDLLTQ